MSLRESHSPTTRPVFPALVAMVRKFAPSSGAATEERAASELERLALTSPHLLADLGFRQDLTAGRAGETVWRNGALEVAVRRETGPIGARATRRSG